MLHHLQSLAYESNFKMINDLNNNLINSFVKNNNRMIDDKTNFNDNTTTIDDNLSNKVRKSIVNFDSKEPKDMEIVKLFKSNMKQSNMKDEIVDGLHDSSFKQVHQ